MRSHRSTAPPCGGVDFLGQHLPAPTLGPDLDLRGPQDQVLIIGSARGRWSFSTSGSAHACRQAKTTARRCSRCASRTSARLCTRPRPRPRCARRSHRPPARAPIWVRRAAVRFCADREVHHRAVSRIAASERDALPARSDARPGPLRNQFLLELFVEGGVAHVAPPRPQSRASNPDR